MTRVCVITGGRGHTPTPRELRELHTALEAHDIATVRTGTDERLMAKLRDTGIGGVDEHVYAHVRDIWDREMYPATDYGKWPACGPIRNRAMLKTGDVVLVVAFSGGDGTLDCITQAKQRDIPVHVITCSAIESRKKAKK